MKYLLTLLLILPISVSFAQDRDTAAMKEKAWNAYMEDEYTEAITISDILLVEDSTRADVYMLRGLCLVSKGEFEDGLNDLERAIRLQPDNMNYWITRGNIYGAMLEYRAALGDMTNAYDLLPPYDGTNDSVHFVMNGMMGWSYINLRSYDSAMMYYNKILAIDSNNRMAIHNAIIIEIERKNFAKADHLLKKYQRLVGEDLEPKIMYVWYYVSVGEYKKAIKLAEDLLRIEKRPYGELLSNKAYAHYKLGELDQALEDIDRSIELNPANSYAYKNRALIYIAMGKAADACTDLRTALDLNYTLKFGTEVEELYVEHCNKM